MRLELFHRRDQPARTGGDADAETGHRVALGHAGDSQHPLGQIRAFDCERGVSARRIAQRGIDIVAEDEHLGVRAQHLAQRLQFGRRIRRAGRVAGAVEQQPAGARGDCSGQLRSCNAKSPGGVSRQRNDVRPGKAHDLRIADPPWAGDQHVVTGIERGEQRVEDRLLAARADRDLAGRDRDAEITREMQRRRGLHPRRSADRGILGVAGIERGLGRGDDMIRGGEIRLADRQRDDVMTGCPQIGRAIGHRRGARCRDAGKRMG